MVDVFVSHSSEDARLAEQLVRLLRSPLNLRAHQIRCTSVDGYRLPAGADTDETLREEVLEARAFISILSSSSLSSVYVLFELGARWGTKQPLFPLLAPGIDHRALRGPLTGLNTLSCESAAQLHQLVSDVGKALAVEAESPAVYQGDIEAILYSARSQEGHSSALQQEEARSGGGVGTAEGDPNGASSAPEDDYSEAERVIRRHCEREWPDDYSMQNHCVKQQREALAVLKQARPQDVPEEAFAKVRSKCAAEWPDNYAMRQHCEKQQFDSYRALEREPN